ncbi:MAG: ABC transporter substrate-binding protein [Chloroflexi bacterium]|nr:ABC transporter substrate-binding protein [Chloroflexota bacterium]
MVGYIGIDDTDNLESRGTGHLARAVANRVGEKHHVVGIVRHQLLYDPRVPYTSHNSSASIIFEPGSDLDLQRLFSDVRLWMMEQFQPGSDPGLCICIDPDESLTSFGIKAQQEIVTQDEARALALHHGTLLEGLGGTQDGVIGALAAVGLSAGGNDGRYIQFGTIRDLTGILSINELLLAGLHEVRTIDGKQVTEGYILADKLRPARRESKAILFVEKRQDTWYYPLKLD